MAFSTVLEITRQDLEKLETPISASITDVKALSSYNWIEAPADTPTIAIPGSPPLWSALRAPQRLKQDSGLVYIAQNAARHPESPLEPLFRALFTAHPSFNIQSTDVVSDRNNIRKLLSFVDPSSATNRLDPFTMNIEMRKKTAIFCRDEAKTMEYIEPHEFRGFGHEFEKAFTVSQMKGSTGHHRIISYRFGGLNFLIRHETDAYVASDGEASASSPVKDNLQTDLSGMLDALSLSQASTAAVITPARSKLIIKREGYDVPLRSTLEIKTRVSHKAITFEEVVPQLWVSQTPKLVRAYHQKGIFQSPVVEDVTAQIESWQERKQYDLKKLAALIGKIIVLVKECGGHASLKYSVEGDKLVICKAKMKEMLPKDLYAKWETNTINRKDDVQKSDNSHAVPEIASIGSNIKHDDKAAIKMGDTVYTVPISKLPYFASFVRREKATQRDSNEISHEPIKLFDVGLKGWKQYRTLFETYKCLGVDILSGLSSEQVIANLKVGRSDYDPDERRHIRGDKSLARDTAFQLLYLILYANLEDRVKDGMKLYNAVMFVVSHPRTFKNGTKRVIRLAYEERFSPTIKQRQGLDKWENSGDGRYERDETTEGEPDCCFDSDDSF